MEHTAISRGRHNLQLSLQYTHAPLEARRPTWCAKPNSTDNEPTRHFSSPPLTGCSRLRPTLSPPPQDQIQWDTGRASHTSARAHVSACGRLSRRSAEVEKKKKRENRVMVYFEAKTTTLVQRGINPAGCTTTTNALPQTLSRSEPSREFRTVESTKQTKETKEGKEGN